MTISKKQAIGLTIILSATVFAVIWPFVYIIKTAGSHWQGILPAGYVADSDFYILRMVKGTDNFPFGNNPFILENAGDTNPALSIADYLGAIPHKAGLSVLGAVVFNAVFWNLILVFLLWLFLKQLGIKDNWSFYLIPAVYLNIYGAMVRPVVAEIVLPFFLFFLLMFLVWLKRPTKQNSLVFALSIAGVLYIYPYSWQFAFAALGFYFLWLLKNHNWSQAKLLVIVIGGALIVGLPAVLSIYKIMTNALFPELLENVGSIQTRFPSELSFQLARWVIINSILRLSVARLMPTHGEDKGFRYSRVFLMSIGFGMLAVLMSPFITGRDGAIGDHTGRELFFWLSISTTTIAYLVFSHRDFFKLSFSIKAVIILFIAVNLIPVIKHSQRSIFQPFNADRTRIIAAQDYAKPIEWLNQYDDKPSVVLADGDIGSYFPIYSKFYTLDYIDAVYQYWVNKSEVQERVLLSSYFKELTLEELGTTTLIGNRYMRQFPDLEWKMRICKMFNFLRSTNECHPKTSSFTFDDLTFQKNEEIQNLMEKYNKEIKPNINQLLKKYSVKYVIKDLLKGDPDFRVEKFKNIEEIYNDGRFVIYKFK